MSINTIEKIEVVKKKYKLTINKKQYLIDEFYYQCLLPYIGKKIEVSTYLELIAFSSSIDILSRLYKSIFDHSLSRKGLYIKLKEKEIEADKVRLIVARFIEEGYLKDEDFISYHKYYYEINKGVNAFASFLRSNGIKEDLVCKACNEYEENYDFVLHYINNYLKSRTNSTKMATLKITSYLKSKGFSDGIIKEAFKEANINDELTSLQTEVKKYKRMYEDNNKIIRKLLSKGYNLEDIKKELGDDSYED